MLSLTSDSYSFLLTADLIKKKSTSYDFDQINIVLMMLVATYSQQNDNRLQCTQSSRSKLDPLQSIRLLGSPHNIFFITIIPITLLEAKQ